MNTTDEYWDIGGTSLQNYAWNITTEGGGRNSTPSLRGDDVTVPFAPGQVFMRKVPDSREITLRMWVQGSQINGQPPTDRRTKQLFEKNLRELRKLIWKPRKEVSLTKRFWVPTAELTAGGVSTGSLTKVGDYSLYSATARAQMVGGFEYTMQGNSHATFEVDFKLADPYFYSEELSVSLVGGSRNLTVLGDDRTHAVTLEFVGPRAGITLRNNTLPVEFWYPGSIATGNTVVAKVKDFTATSGATNVVGGVRHSGDSFWFPLEPGVNALSYSTTSGSGATTLKYQPVWI